MVASDTCATRYRPHRRAYNATDVAMVIGRMAARAGLDALARHMLVSTSDPFCSMHSCGTSVDQARGPVVPEDVLLFVGPGLMRLDAEISSRSSTEG